MEVLMRVGLRLFQRQERRSEARKVGTGFRRRPNVKKVTREITAQSSLGALDEPAGLGFQGLCPSLLFV